MDSKPVMDVAGWEAFVHGVFAIAVTLLVLDIRVPDAASIDSGSALVRALFDEMPRYSAYVLGFFCLGTYWINVHRAIRTLRGIDHGYIVIGLLFLMVIAAVPFVTALLAEYIGAGNGRDQVALVVFTAWQLVLAVLANVSVRYVYLPPPTARQGERLGGQPAGLGPDHRAWSADLARRPRDRPPGERHDHPRPHRDRLRRVPVRGADPRGAGRGFLVGARPSSGLTTMQDEPGRTIASGYDRISERYLAWIDRIEGDPRDRMLAAFAGRLPAGARVLDLGCGPGVPSTRALAERFEVVGVDISAAQIELARANVPEATFIHGDFTAMDLPDASLDGVTAFYSITHVPRQGHAELFARIARWLVPGGLFLASLGASDSPDWVGEWLGVPMFFSSHDAETNRALLRDAGFELLLDEIVEMREPEGPVSFLWVIARKASDARG